MELCAQPHSDTSIAMEYQDKCNNDTRASCQERNKNEKFDNTRDCQSLGLTMTWQEGRSSGYNSGQDFDLNIEEILTLFQGSRENLNYFLGLWSAMKINPMVDSKDSHVPGGGEMDVESRETVTCDPRDERKRRNVKDWRPSVRVCPVGVGGGDHDVGLSSRVCDGGDEEEGGGGCGDDFEALTTGKYAVKQTVLDTGSGSGRSDEEEFVMNSGKDAMMTTGPVEESDGEKMSGFSCGVYGCGQVLTGLASYEAHYHQCHNYVCDACRRVFVSNFLLDVHLEENHDSYFAVLSHRIDMFRCLVESCQQKFRTPALRKDHLVSVHKFPSSFSFHQPVNVKANRSEERVWNCSKSVKTDVMMMGGDSNSNPGSNGADTGMVVDSPGLTSGRTALDQGQESVQRKRVPASICFGRGSQRTFQPRRGRGGRRGRGNNKGHNWFQRTGGGDGDGYSTPDTTTRVDIEVVDMKELEDALT